MKTKIAKVPGTPVSPVTDQEPTDEELRAIEQDAAATAEGVANALASTPLDISRLGLNQIAYLRRTVVDDEPIWSIYSAMGHPLGAAPSLEQAWGAVVQNDLQPMFVN